MIHIACLNIRSPDCYTVETAWEPAEVDLASITAKTLSNGDNILLGDLGFIRTEIVPVNQFFQGRNPAIIMRVDRGQEGDAIAMQEKVERTIETFKRSMPESLKIELSGTRSEAIKNRLNLLISNGVIGLVLVLFFLFIFLSAETAFWVAIGIPIALFASFGLMFVVGISINLISFSNQTELSPGCSLGRSARTYARSASALT